MQEPDKVTEETITLEDGKQDESSEYAQTENALSEENSDDTSITTQESNEVLVRKIEVNGQPRVYTLENNFASCSIIEALNVDYNATPPYSFLDIQDSPYKNSIQQFRNLNLVHGTIN